jgi:predicted phage gp36 major capsid-like protein
VAGDTVFYRRVQGKETADGSLIEELRRREDAARAEADRLRSRIEELSEDLARAEEQVSRLAIAREEVARVLEEPAPEGPPAGQNGRPAGETRPVSRIGAVTVPPWQVGAEASVLSAEAEYWLWHK